VHNMLVQVKKPLKLVFFLLNLRRSSNVIYVYIYCVSVYAGVEMLSPADFLQK